MSSLGKRIKAAFDPRRERRRDRLIREQKDRISLAEARLEECYLTRNPPYDGLLGTEPVDASSLGAANLMFSGLSTSIVDVMCPEYRPIDDDRARRIIEDAESQIERLRGSHGNSVDKLPLYIAPEV